LFSKTGFGVSGKAFNGLHVLSVTKAIAEYCHHPIRVLKCTSKITSRGSAEKQSSMKDRNANNNKK